MDSLSRHKHVLLAYETSQGVCCGDRTFLWAVLVPGSLPLGASVTNSDRHVLYAQDMSRLKGVWRRVFGFSRGQCAWLSFEDAKFCIERNSANAKFCIGNNSYVLRRSVSQVESLPSNNQLHGVLMDVTYEHFTSDST